MTKNMRKILLLGTLFLAMGCLRLSAQIIFCNNEVSKTLTAYTNGAPNDSIYYYCNGQLGQLRANPPGGTGPWTFTWRRFAPASNSWTPYSNQANQTASTLSNLQPGGYQVTIVDATGATVGQDIAWVSQITTNPSVQVAPIAPGCTSVNLQGTITNGALSPYYNPPGTFGGGTPPPAQIFGPNTSLTVTYNGTHSFVSDLAFVMTGPTSCGSPLIYLLQSAEYASGTAVCNGGDNFTNLSFSTASTNSISICTAAVPLTGTYGRYATTAGSTAINWSALNGCSLSDPGWSFQVWDCVAGDAGTLSSVTATFGGTDAAGAPVNLVFSSGALNAGISSGTTTTSCPIENSGLAPASYTITTPPATPIACTNGYIWTANPPFTIPNATSSLNITLNPGPTVPTTFTLTLTGSCSMAGCGTGNTTDSELYNYITPTTAVIEPVATLCNTDAAVTLVCNLTNGTWSGTGITDAANGVFDPAVAGVGNHMITFTPGLPCQTPASIQIRVNPWVDPTITPVAQVCINDAAFNLVAATPGGIWSGPGITSSLNGTFNPSIAGPGIHTVTYFIPNACNNIATFDVDVDDDPTITLTSPEPFCTGLGTLPLTADVLGGTWSGTGIVDPITGDFDPTSVATGDYEITYLLPGACMTDTSFTVQVRPTVDPAITSPGVLCETGNDITLTAITPGGIWSGTGIVNANAGVFSPSTAGPGLHTVTYTIANACNGVGTIDIQVASFDVPTVSGPAEMCIGEASVVLTAVPAGGVFTGTGITNPNGEFTPASAGAGNAVITYTYNNGCQTVDQHAINVITTIAVPITDLGPVCVTDSPFQFTNAVAGGTWTGTGIVDATLGTFNPATSGVGTFVVTYTYNGTCSGTDQTSIEVQAVPQPIISDPGALCANQTNVTLGVSVGGGTWTGAGVSSATLGTYNPSLVGVGNYTVTYTIDDVCYAQTQRSLTVNPNPSVSAGSDVTICSYETATLQATPGGWDNASWSNGGVGETLTVGNAGTYTVTVTEGGCSSSDNVVVSVNQMPILDLGNTRNLCEGSTETITSGPSGVSGTWSAGGFGSSIEVTQPGVYTFIYQNNNCSVRDSVEVIYYDAPQFDLGPNRTTCPDEPVVLAVPYTGVWSTGFTGGSLNITSSGTYSVSVANGPCLVSDEITITILPAPIANLKAEYTYCKGQQRTLSAYNPVNEGYMWSTGADSASIVVKEPGSYSVTTYNVCGTAESSTIVVEEDCTYSIYVPSSFTPNNDGFNDYWKPVVYNLVEYEVSIFNRWGERIWFTTDTEAAWTGEVKEGDYYTPDGLYFFVVRFKTDRQEAGEERGSIFVIR